MALAIPMSSESSNSSKIPSESSNVPNRPILSTELSKHNKIDNTESDHDSRGLWLAIHGSVYDFTNFVNLHPGGSQILLKYGGKDATKVFSSVHSTDLLDEDQRPKEVILKGIYVKESNGKKVNESPSQSQSQTVLKVKTKQESSKESDLDETSDTSTIKIPYPNRPPIHLIYNIFDLESVGRKNCTKEAWGYLASAGDDEVTLRENSKAFHRVFVRPRVLRNVKEVDTSVVKSFGSLNSSRKSQSLFDKMSMNIFGSKLKEVKQPDQQESLQDYHKFSVPFYVSATALGKLYDPEHGERAIVRATGKRNVVYMCPTLASCSMEEMARERREGQKLWYQLYVNPNRKITSKVIQKAKNLGFQALVVTVDAPQFGRRERDMRNKAKIVSAVQADSDFKKEASKTFTNSKGQGQGSQPQALQNNMNQGTAQMLTAWIDPSLNWNDLEWIKKEAYPLPVFLKGIQTKEDAYLAYQHQVNGIIVSNHGGRQLDYCRSGLECLEEIMEGQGNSTNRESMSLESDQSTKGLIHLLPPNTLNQTFHVFVDGGVRRGSDIFKALALGASMVGIGRPSLYGLAAYGEPGVEKCLELLENEFRMVMKLMGCVKIEDIKREMIITRDLKRHITTVPDGFLESNYKRLLNIDEMVEVGMGRGKGKL